MSKYGSNAARQRAYRERQKTRLVAESDPAARDRGPYADVPDHELTPAQEQEIRDWFGYAKSETRTRAQRQATAARIMARPDVQEDLTTAREIWRRQAIAMENSRHKKADPK